MLIYRGTDVYKGQVIIGFRVRPAEDSARRTFQGQSALLFFSLLRLLLLPSSHSLSLYGRSVIYVLLRAQIAIQKSDGPRRRRPTFVALEGSDTSGFDVRSLSLSLSLSVSALFSFTGFCRETKPCEDGQKRKKKKTTAPCAARVLWVLETNSRKPNLLKQKKKRKPNQNEIKHGSSPRPPPTCAPGCGIPYPGVLARKSSAPNAPINTIGALCDD